MALSGGPFSTSAPYVFAAFVSNGTTPPAFNRGTNIALLANPVATATNLFFATNGTGTTLPNSFTLSSNSSAGAISIWCAIS
jgi:hypothetical protein